MQPSPTSAVLLASNPTSPVREAESTGTPSVSTGPPTSLSLEDLRNLTSIEDIDLQLRLLNFEEAQVDNDLDALLRDRVKLERELEGLELLRCVRHSFQQGADAILINCMSWTRA